MAKLEIPQEGLKGYAIKGCVILGASAILFGAGFFVSLRVSGGSADLDKRYGEVVSNLDAAVSAQRIAQNRVAGLSNELVRASVSIGILRARVADSDAAIARIEGANRRIGEIQSNVTSGIIRASGIADESGYLIGELTNLVRELQTEKRQ